MSFSKQDIVVCFNNTLSNDQNTRQVAEQTLVQNLAQPNFLNFLLNLAGDDSVDNSIKLSSVIFVKNSINKFWLKRNQQVQKLVANVEINENDKKLIKTNLVQVLTQAVNNHVVVKHLLSIFSSFLNSGINDNNFYGNELIVAVENLMKDGQTNSNHLLSALLIVYELTKYYRWSIQGFNISVTSKLNQADQVNGSIILLNKLTRFIFPILLNLSSSILNNISSSSNLVEDTLLDQQFHLLYLVLKIFKFTTFNDLPECLLTFENNKYVNLDDWIQLQFVVFKLVYPINYSSIRKTTGIKDYRIKSQKWSVSNLVRIFWKYSGVNDGQIDVNSYNINVERHTKALQQFQSYFKHVYLSQYFENFFVQIDQWHNKKTLIFDESLYYLVKFFHYSLNDNAVFNNYLAPNLNTLIQYLIFPSIIISEENLSVFYEDDEEFFRKIYDLNNDFHKPDSVSVNFLYKLSNKYFDVVISWLFDFLNKSFAKRKDYRSANDASNLPESIQQDVTANNNTSDLQALKLKNALETEASLRVVGILSYHLLSKESSPALNQIDHLIATYITPELFDHEFLFLTSRALETLATFNYKFTDASILYETFKGILSLLDKEILDDGSGSGPVDSNIKDSFLVQVEALDALRSLLVNEDITNFLKGQINKLVARLLQLISEYEIDFLTTILDEFISAFSTELKPFADELSVKLSSQFLKIANELLEVSSNKAEASATDSTNMESLVTLTAAEDDKESQCIGILNNLSVMVENMANEKLLLVRFSINFDPCIKFVVHNSMIGLLDDVMQLSTLLLRSLGRVTRSIQSNFDHILDVFSHVGYEEYFDYFNNFFESYVTSSYNFKYYLANDFSNKIQSEIQTGNNGADLEEVNNELKNTLDIDFFTLDSDARLLSLIKLVTQVLNNSIMDANNRNINACFTLFENIFLSVSNSSFYKALAENNNTPAANIILSTSNVNDSNIQENQVIQSILEASINAFLNSLFVNLEEIVLLTEEDSNLAYVDYEIVYMVNNFLKLLLASFLYKPVLTIHVVKNFDKIGNLLDLLNKIDDTNSNQADELAQIPMTNDSSLAFFQLLNKLWLTLNTNNSFVKMKKPNKYGTKLAIISLLKIINNEDSLKSEVAKNENQAKWLSLLLNKAHIKLLDCISEIPKLYENEEKAKKVLQSEGAGAAANAAAALQNNNDGDEDEDDLYLELEDFDDMDNFNLNEQQRLKLLNFGKFTLPNKVDFKVINEFMTVYNKASGGNSATFNIMNAYVKQKNINESIEQAVHIDKECLLSDF